MKVEFLRIIELTVSNWWPHKLLTQVQYWIFLFSQSCIQAICCGKVVNNISFSFVVSSLCRPSFKYRIDLYVAQTNLSTRLPQMLACNLPFTTWLLLPGNKHQQKFLKGAFGIGFFLVLNFLYLYDHYYLIQFISVGLKRYVSLSYEEFSWIQF